MSEKRQRQAAIRFRVTSKEGQAIATAARKIGVSVSAFARHMTMLATSENAPSLNAEERLLRDFVAEVQRIGLIVRKEAVLSADSDRVVHELRRLQHFVLRAKSAAPE